MILQYADGGTLSEYLEHNFEDLTWLDKLRLAKEITNGLLTIHNKIIIHRDLVSLSLMFFLLREYTVNADFNMLNIL